MNVPEPLKFATSAIQGYLGDLSDAVHCRPQ
jgi:hypothetical protein